MAENVDNTVSRLQAFGLIAVTAWTTWCLTFGYMRSEFYVKNHKQCEGIVE